MQIFEIETMINLNQLNYTNRQIAKYLNIHHNTVSYHLDKYGLKSSWANEPINMISKNKARCSKCKLIKSINEFQYGKKDKNYEYRFSYCNKCRKKQCYTNINKHINKRLRDKYFRLKARCKLNNIKINITDKDLINLYNYQKGKCFYTGIIMEWRVGKGLNKNTLSIDKVKPKLGYIKGNVVLCTYKTNRIKSDLDEKELKLWIPKWYNKTKKLKKIWKKLKLTVFQVDEGDF